MQHNKNFYNFSFVILLVSTSFIFRPQNSFSFSLSLPGFGQSKCSKLPWTKDDSRTQGDGWIWFPGKATAGELDRAYLRAEGMAVARLMQECGFPHKEVKIHERCDERVGNFFRAFVRINLRDKQCQETKYASLKIKELIINKELMKIYNSYRRSLGEDAENIKQVKECSPINSQKCYELGKYQFHMGNIRKALGYFDIACKLPNYTACFNAGLAAWTIRLKEKAIGYFQLSCDKNDALGCLFAAHVEDIAGNSTFAGKLIQKSCDLGEARGCLGLGKHHERSKNIRGALKAYKKSCEMKNREGCHLASTLYYDKKKWGKASDFAKTGCDLGHKKSCFNYGFLQKKSNNTEEAKKFFKVACDMGSDSGCYELGKMTEKVDN